MTDRSESGHSAQAASRAGALAYGVLRTARMANGTPAKAIAAVPQRRAGLRLACVLVLTGSLLALASPWLARVWIGFDLFTQLLPHMAAVGLAALACLFWGRRSGILVGMAILLATAVAIASVSLIHASSGFTHRTSGDDIRLMSFNLWRGNRQVEAVEREIRRNLPDIVAMPEFEEYMWGLPARLRDILPYHASCVQDPFCRLGLLSRWPIVRMKSASLWEGPPYLHAWIRTPRGIVQVYVVHTLRAPWIRSHYKQMRAMARMVRQVAPAPVIVMGDFNAAPYSYILNVFPRHAGLQRHSWLPTWPARPLLLPQIAIDHVFASEHFGRKGGPWVGRPAGSDHLPLILELQRR